MGWRDGDIWAAMAFSAAVATVVIVLFFLGCQRAQAIELITLHMIDGLPIEVNPHQVTQIRPARDEDNPKKALHKKVRCIVGFTDGRWTSVLEECDAVRKLMGE